jgi:hypothetical protein
MHRCAGLAASAVTGSTVAASAVCAGTAFARTAFPGSGFPSSKVRRYRCPPIQCWSYSATHTRIRSRPRSGSLDCTALSAHSRAVRSGGKRRFHHASGSFGLTLATSRAGLPGVVPLSF